MRIGFDVRRARPSSQRHDPLSRLRIVQLDKRMSTGRIVSLLIVLAVVCMAFVLWVQ